MSYLKKLDSDDISYLMEHKEGGKCWQTDYRLLRELHGEIAKANFDEDALVRQAYNENAKRQKNLFSEAELAEL